MRHPIWVATVLILLGTCVPRLHAQTPCCEPSSGSLLRCIAPAGGWFPYGGGVLHWWDPHCFPRGGAPDDYCHKPLPCVCWPPFTSCYSWGSPEICYPCGGCKCAATEPPLVMQPR